MKLSQISWIDIRKFSSWTVKNTEFVNEIWLHEMSVSYDAEINLTSS